MTLIEQLEKAEGPSRVLDEKVSVFIGKAERRGGVLYKMHPTEGSTNTVVRAPAYTSSIDAALTLVADGLLWTVSQHSNLAPASLYRRNADGDIETACSLTAANTPALAICAAALKARENNDG